jgi:GntR family transcriptional regulator, carbon starvation induced regulator
MDPLSFPATLANRLVGPYEQIREDIIAGNLLPDAKLKTRDLRQRYKTGTSPLREALSKLAAEGFTTQTENRGFRVALADLARYDEMVQAKCWIESIALRESIAHGSAQWEHGVVIASYDLEKGILSLEKDKFLYDAKFEVLHKRFHMALIAGCSNHQIESICAQLYDHTTRYRSLYRPKVTRDTRGDEHKQLSAAALARDANKAVTLLRDHYLLTAELLRADMERARNTPPQARSRPSRRRLSVGRVGSSSQKTKRSATL